MRTVFLAVLLVTAPALAAHSSKDNDKSNVPGIAAPRAPETVRSVTTPNPVMDRLRGVGQHDRPDGHRGKERGKHHHDHDDWGYPYPYPPIPETWPFPPTPYYQYYYPYPPQYYPGGYADEDDTHSTRGLTVPGDLPMGVTSYWYYCEKPDGYYPYVKSCTRDWTRIPVSPPPPGVAPPLSYSDWQWCEESKGFFPYVTACKAGFEPLPVTSPSDAGPPAAANWFFCEDPKGYAPYVVQCRRDWRPVPAVPPPSVKITVKDEKAK